MTPHLAAPPQCTPLEPCSPPGHAPGLPSGTVELPTLVSYSAGFSASTHGVPAANAATVNNTKNVGNTGWVREAAGCSLRVGARGGTLDTSRPALYWTLPEELFEPCRASKAFTLEALVRVDAFRQVCGWREGEQRGLMLGGPRALLRCACCAAPVCAAPHSRRPEPPASGPHYCVGLLLLQR